MKKWFLLTMVIALFLGISYLIFTQTQPTITKSVEITLNVMGKPDLSLSVSPTELNVVLGKTAVYSCSVTSINYFDGEVVLSASGNPAGITIAFLPTNTFSLLPGETKGAQIEISVADDDTLIGTKNITITATSDNYTQSIN